MVPVGITVSVVVAVHLMGCEGTSERGQASMCTPDELRESEQELRDVPANRFVGEVALVVEDLGGVRGVPLKSRD
jgi:hypothetical protein